MVVKWWWSSGGGGSGGGQVVVVVVVKWPARLPPTPTIRVRIPLKPRVFH